jgi:CHAD domain-containing protein
MDRTAQVLSSPGHPVRQCRDILRWQITCAVQYLDADSDSLNVHAARKELKRARATLRLLRPALHEQIYRRENTAVRDAARRLSGLRDAEVLSAALENLLGRYDPTNLELGPLHAALRRRRLGAAKTLQAAQVRSLRMALERTRTRSLRWRLPKDDWSVLARGLRDTYRQGRRSLRAARASPDGERLHDWRKQTKYLWHQLQILTPLAPGVIGELADEFHHLSNYLGDEHDLAVLQQTAEEHARVLDTRALRALKALIDERRSGLQARAFALGKRLYSDRASSFSARFDELWLKWRRGARPKRRAPAQTEVVARRRRAQAHKARSRSQRAQAPRTGTRRP